MNEELRTQLLVIGAGPAGYAAAFRAADLGIETTIVEQGDTLGGVCLNVGCIPSKALLHVTGVMRQAMDLAECGVDFKYPTVDLDRIRAWKNEVVGQLTGGLEKLAGQRRVSVVKGRATFNGPREVSVAGGEGTAMITFDHCIVAAGSRPQTLPFVPADDSRVWDSTDALSIPFVPGRLLVIGGGIIGLEMATVYSGLGSKVDVVEYTKQIIPVLDRDVASLYARSAKKQMSIGTGVEVVGVRPVDEGLLVELKGRKAPEEPVLYDAVLVAVGRTPNGNALGLENAGVEVLPSGFIPTGKTLETNVEGIYAIGDITGQPMLAHKGAHEGHVAAEAIAGLDVERPGLIPSIAYTNPEIAWVGMTEKDAKERGLDYEVALFPFSALGRAIASQNTAGRTKLLFEKESQKVLGGAVVGEHAGELIGELTLAVELGLTARQLAETVHAHPTLHESIGLASEVMHGTVTDLPNRKASK